MKIKKINWLNIFLIFALTGCSTTSNIREVELFPMGDNRFTLFIRGNNLVTKNDVKTKWYEEAARSCKFGFTVEEIGFQQVEMYGYTKPAVEGIFKCK
jgi:hypothetical protein